MVTSGDRGGELFIRGGTPAQNLILVDNIPVIKPFHISNLFSAFPQETISSAELYAGGFGAEYAGATSAVLDVNLRQGNMRRFEGSAAASPYMLSMRLEGPLKRDEQSLLFMGRTSMLERTAPTLIGQDVPLTFYDMTTRYSVNWAEVVCSITGMHTYDRGRINPERNVELTWGNTAFGARCLGFGEEIDHAVDFSLGYSSYHSTESGIDNTERSSGIRIGFLRLDNAWEIFGLPLDYGARLDFVQYSAQLDEPFAERSGSGVRFTHWDSTIDQLTSTFSGYTVLNWQPIHGLTLKPGLVTQITLSTISPTMEPRLRMTWKPGGSDRHEWSLAAGRYMQVMEAISDERDAGTVFYVYKPVDRKDPLPEAMHGILGYRRQFSNNLEVSVESYAKHHRHIPVARWTREPGNTINTALAEGSTLGFDFQAEYSYRRFFVLLGYGLSKTTYRADANELVAWIDGDVFRYNPPHDRRHQLNLISSIQFAGFTANAIWQYSSGNPYTRLFALDVILDVTTQHPLTDRGRVVSLYSEPFDGRFPSFHRLDVSLGRPFRLAPGIILEAEIGAVNAYNIQNIFYFDVNTMQQVDELPFLPYMSLSVGFR